jgi:hypothetical protein
VSSSNLAAYLSGMSPRRRKPPKSASILRFPKHGKVTREERSWPTAQADQELEIAEMFAALLEEWNGRKLLDLRPLAESDHDVGARVGDTRVEIEVTELVTREFVIEELGPGAFRIDTEGLNDALTERIRAKVDKGYTKSTGVRLILLVYSLDPGGLEFLGHNTTQPDGTPEVLVPEGLRRTQQFAAENAGPFDEIWYVVPTAGSRPGLLAGVLPAEA